MQRSRSAGKSVKPQSKLIPNEKQLQQMNMNELKKYAKNIIPGYKHTPIKGWKNMTFAQRKLQTKIKKDSLVYYLNQQINNKQTSLEEQIVSNVSMKKAGQLRQRITEDRTASGAKRRTINYVNPIRRSDMSFEELMTTLSRIERYTSKSGVQSVMLGIQFANDYRLMRIQDLIQQEIRYMDRYASFDQDYSIHKIVIISVAPIQAACDSEEHMITVCVSYEGEQTLKIKAKSYKSQNQNCFIAIFKHASKSSISYPQVRKQINIGPKDAIPITELPKIADMFNCGYIIYNSLADKLEVIESYETDREILVEAIIIKGHAYHIINLPTELRTNALRMVQVKQPNVSKFQEHGYKQTINDPSLEQIQELVNEGRHLIIHGAGGVGKSYIAKALKKVLLCATTGIAAQNIGGKTIDYIMCAFKTKNQFTKAYPSITHILIDEASMIGAGKLSAIWNFCIKINLNVILVGDMCQLPPVRDAFFFSTLLWREYIQPNFTLINLTVIKRQNKVEQQEFLNNMRLGCFDFNYFKKLRAQPAIENPDMIIVSTNELRAQYNNKYFKRLSGEAIVMDHIKNVMVNGQEAKPLNKDVIKTIMKECYQYEPEAFKIGCRIMVTENLDYSQGIVNGTRGYVKDIVQNSHIVITSDEGQTFKVNYKIQETNFGKDKITFEELPIVVAYALTCHKSQGQTVNSALIDTNNLFENGQLYVALSRVRDLDNVQIIGQSNKEYIEKWSQPNPQALDFCKGVDVFGKDEEHLIDYWRKQLSGVRRKTIGEWANNNMIFFDFETRNTFEHNFVKQVPYFNHISHYLGDKQVDQKTLFDQLWTGGERCDVQTETYNYIKKEMLRYTDSITININGKDYLNKQTYKKLRSQVPTLIGYNSSGFDMHFIVTKLLNDKELKGKFHISTIYKGSYLISFMITDLRTNKMVLRSHDIYQIINLPLKKALEQFCKGQKDVAEAVDKIEFRDEIIYILKNYTNNPNILKEGVLTPIYKYQNVEDGIRQTPALNEDGTHKIVDLNKEVILYAKNDTNVLLPLYRSVNALFEKYLKASIFNFLTVGSAAWYGFLINLPAQALLEGSKNDKHGNAHKMINTKLYRPEMKEQEFINQAKYGGRVAPRIHQIKKEEVMEDTREQQRDCRPVYLDISGMYCSIMKKEILPYGKSYWLSQDQIKEMNDYITKLSRSNTWQSIHEKLLRKYNLFIAEVDFAENPYNPEPVIPYKHNGRTYYINDRRTQVISSIDIALIIQSGGTIYNISKVLQWESYGNIMGKWMEKCLEIKEEGARNGDSGVKAFGKLLANSSYGQTLKGDKREKIQFIDNINQAVEFCDKYELTNFIDYENFDAYIGKMKLSKFEFISSRCQAIGVYVLAYTRSMIFDICEIAMPNRYNEQGVKEQPFNGDTDSLAFRKWQADLLIKAGWVGLENGKLTDELGEESLWFNPPSAKDIIEQEKLTGKDFRYGLVNELIYKTASYEEKHNPTNFHFTYINSAIFSAPKSYAVNYHNNVNNKDCEKMRFKGISTDSTIKVGDDYQTMSYGLIESAYALRHSHDDKKFKAVLPNKPQVLKRPSKAEGTENMFAISNCNERRRIDKKNKQSAYKAVSRILFKTQWKGRHHYTDNVTLPYGHPLSISFEEFISQTN